MRILFITDFYPPEHKGGYEIRIESIVNSFRSNGNQIKVLTTKTNRQFNLPDFDYIKRVLNHDDYGYSLFKRIILEIIFLRRINSEIKEFRPDVVYLGHVINYPKTLLFYLNNIHKKIVFDEGGIGLIAYYKHKGAWFYFIDKLRNSRFAIFIVKLFIKAILPNLPVEKKWNDNLFAIFNSENTLKSTLDKGVILKNPIVIQSGVDLGKFNFNSNRLLSEPIKVIVPGRITRIKGQILAIPFLTNLMKSFPSILLDFPGKVEDETYFDELKLLLHENNLLNSTTFSGHLSHEVLAEKYFSADICLFPSKQIFGFSRVPIESLASGCLLFTYGMEGSDVFLLNSLAFDLNEGNDIVQEKCMVFYNSKEEYLTHIGLARTFTENHFSLNGYLKKVNNTVEEFVSNN